MPLDVSETLAAESPRRPYRLPPRLMLAGMAGACLLGAGLGLWARPSLGDQGGALPERSGRRPAAVASAPRQLEIRLAGPPPAPAPLPVGPAPVAPAPVAPAREQVSEPLPPARVTRVRADAPERLSQPRRPTQAKAPESAVRPKTPAHEDAKAAAAPAKPKAAASKTARRKDLRVAQAAPKTRPPAERRAETRTAESAAAKPKAKTQLAQRREEHKVPAAKPTLVRTAAVDRRCGGEDPGAALACSDPALGAADRQLQRAYRLAQDAGVPPERLERQQQRWLAARANAARQAPWAVHDIYLARIAELHDQARAALGED